jgi:hypothetical protein
VNLDERMALYTHAFDDQGGAEVLAEARLSYLLHAFEQHSEPEPESDEIDLEDVAWTFESLGIQALRNGATEAQVIAVFERAFRFRMRRWTDDVPHSLPNLWMLTLSGLLAQRQPELRHLLMRLDLDAALGPAPDDWGDRVLWEAVRAFLLLARKDGGWRDVDEALEALRSLSNLQKEAQELYLAAREGDDAKTVGARRLVGLYHLAEALGVLGRYLRTGEPAQIRTTLQRHSEHCRHLLGGAGDFGLEQVGSSVEVALVGMAEASIWANTNRMSEGAREFARRLVSDDREDPVTELWWSQREALTEHMLDAYTVAVSVQMPTSAGKTLLAEFAIVQSLALNPSATVAYIVPTRALVNQMTRRLRADLEGGTIGTRPVRVESAVPVFELDPTEDLLLSERPDILITTPEKLDLLVRSGHAAVANLSLVVVDEAHHIAEPTRGPRLELLLATLKRERGDRCHFLLLTPFLPNAEDLSRWLGDASHGHISLEWKPSEQLRALGKWSSRKGVFHNVLELLPSATQPEGWAQEQINLGPAPTDRTSKSRPGIASSLAAKLSQGERGGILILTGGPSYAEDRVEEIVRIAGSLIPGASPDQASLIDAATSYIASELGDDYPLVTAIRNGAAFHHAGLPPEIRGIVEVLIERGCVRVVAGTSTLAQGVNFPISGVIVESLKVPQGRGKPWRALQYSEFWNVAGRAGRALKDPIGLVVWPTDGPANAQEFRDYLAGEAVEVVSALAGALVGIDESETTYDLKLVRNQPALSQFLQYLTHALRFAGYDKASGEVEEILRSSLVFHKMREDNRDVAERLVRWSREFLDATRRRPFIDVADATGLSLPSIGYLSARASSSLKDADYWHPDHLFGDDLEPLTELISIIGELPEMSLGLEEEAGGLNAGRVAGIVRDWVRGTTLPEIADRWYTKSTGPKALREAGRYLFRELSNQVPWGLGALQVVTLGKDASNEAETEARRSPALAYYGVREAHALTMRMVGVPRAAAPGLGEGAPEFTSFFEARQWVTSRTTEDWDKAGADRGVSGAVLQQIWTEVGGSA